VPAQAPFAPTSCVCDHELRQLRRFKCHRGPHWRLMELHRARHSATTWHSAPDAYLASSLLDITPDRLVPSLCGVRLIKFAGCEQRRPPAKCTLPRGAARTGVSYAAAQTCIASRCNIPNECLKDADAAKVNHEHHLDHSYRLRYRALAKMLTPKTRSKRLFHYRGNRYRGLLACNVRRTGVRFVSRG
jgi:hypothetical protein